jgi:hypothetical protein
MLDRPNNAWKLLALLTIFSLGFLVLIIKQKPFRDAEGHAGWTVGDKAQVVAQASALLQYAMAALCLAFGLEKPAAVEGFIIIVVLFAIVFPLIYMYKLDKGSDLLGCVFPSSSEADEDGSDGKVVTPISTANPLDPEDPSKGDSVVATASEGKEAAGGGEGGGEKRKGGGKKGKGGKIGKGGGKKGRA